MKQTEEATKLFMMNIFYDIKTGFTSFPVFYEKLLFNLISFNKQNNSSFHITKKIAKLYYTSQPVNQVMKPIKKQKEFTSHTAFYPRNIYQLDIIVYDRYEINKYKYMLVLIDVHSRFLQVRPMTNRKLSTIITNYNNIIKTIGPPDILQSDNEFNKKDFINVLIKDKTTFKFSDPNEMHKNPIVERVNSTIALRLQKVRIALKRYDWYKYIYDVVENYNTSVHSTIKAKPYNVFNEIESNHQKYNKVENPYEVGDRVRLINKKKIFNKGDVTTTSKDIYIIEKIFRNRFLVSGKYYKSYELDKIDNVDDVNDIIIPINKSRKNTITKQLKKESININNIITDNSKRIRKPNPKYN